MNLYRIGLRLLAALCPAVLMLGFAPDAFAEYASSDGENFIQKFERRATATQSKQPGWSVPLLAPHAGLIQSFRADFTRKANTDGTWAWDYGGSKGFNFIPLPNTQLDINVPSYQDKSTDLNDGWGDMSLGLKYRLFTANEKRGNYSAMVGFAATLPTSRSSNGQTHHILTPNVAVGKGWGNFNLQSSAVINLPLGNTSKIGRNVVWNTLAQYKLGKYLWPEIESNMTFYRNNANNGKVASYILPGLMTKLKFRPQNKGSRLTLATGFGWQFAVTPFHPYDHMPVGSIRFGF